MGIFKSSQKVLVGTNSFLSAAIWHSNSANGGHRYSAIYLCIVLRIILFYLFYNFNRSESFVKERKYWKTIFSNGVEILFKYPLYHNVKLINHHFLKYSFKSGDVVIDGDAYHGYSSIFLSKLIGENGKVFSFEAYSGTIDVLEESIRLNEINNIIIIKKLLWFEK